MATCAPSAMKSRAVARPMPLLPPVIRAFLPVSFIMLPFCRTGIRYHARHAKDAVVRNPNPDERVRSCHSSASHLPSQLPSGLFRHHACGVPIGSILEVFDLVRRHQYGSAFVLNQEHYEFRRFGLAGVSPDDVNIRGTFIEGLTRRQSHFLSAPQPHHDRALQHIDKRMCVVAMYFEKSGVTFASLVSSGTDSRQTNSNATFARLINNPLV